MRGLFSFGRSLIKEVREFGLRAAAANLRSEVANAIGDVFAFHWHPDGAQQGMVLYARIPLTRLSALTQWHDIGLGRGIERNGEGFEIYFGRLQVNLCSEQGEMYRSAL